MAQNRMTDDFPDNYSDNRGTVQGARWAMMQPWPPVPIKPIIKGEPTPPRQGSILKGEDESTELG